MEYISVIKEDVDLSKNHRYLRLPHPRTEQPQLYLPYKTPAEEDVILEMVKINGSHRRTWFVGEGGIGVGNLLVHYPIDPLFLVIPIILDLIPAGPPPFQPLSDLIYAASISSTFSLPLPFTSDPKGKAPATGDEARNDDIDRLLAIKSVRRVFKACCEKKVVPAVPASPSSNSPPPPPQRYYRPSRSLILSHLTRKVEAFAQPEEFEKFDHLVRMLGRDGLLEKGADQELLKLARLKAACDHLAQWLPPATLIKLNESYKFASLNTYLANRNAAALAASMPPAKQSKKDAAGTKRKAPPASRGVEQLKKVNTSSMSKLTSFFKPKEKDDAEGSGSKAATTRSKKK
ncbi:hypothetical protein IAT38_007094 [Cryptococcus sp. DSM 104549]